MKIIISGGGTGGHIYPAIAIADALRDQYGAEILFVGAQGKMEMEKVPKAGYKIEGLWISGFQRKLSLQNLAFPFKLLSSWWNARRILKSFKPDAVVGVGGYASGATLKVATWQKIPSLVHEQNSHAGATNRILSKSVQKLCVAYEGMERFFPKEKIIMTGNPIRQDILDTNEKRAEGRQYYGLNPNKKVLFCMGGSLGARTLNDSMRLHLDALRDADVEVMWQCGKLYWEEFSPLAKEYPNVKIHAFIDRMDLAYAAADVVISRAGALSISELCVVGKPVILVPSPNVSADHQTSNAMALVKKDAAIHIKDTVAREEMVPRALELIKDDAQQQALIQQIKQLGITDAAQRIAEEVVSMIPNYNKSN